MKTLLSFILALVFTSYALADADKVNGQTLAAGWKINGQTVAGGGGGASASDDFNRSNGSLGANWTNAVADIVIASNTAANSALNDADSFVYWNAASFAADQSSKVTIVYRSDSQLLNYIAAGVRMSGSGGSYDGYVASTDGKSGIGHTEIGRYDNGAFTSLKSVATTFANGDIIECRAVGTTISIYKNGSYVDSVTDTTYATGQPGFGLYSSISGSQVSSCDNWEAVEL
jgi:hypothetical protein